MDPSVDEDLIGILKNSSLSSQTRLQGWNYIISLSATSVGVRHIVNSGKYLPFILSYITTQGNRTDPDDELVKLAFKALINISSEEQGTLAIVSCRKDIPNYLMSDISEHNSKFVEYKCYILSNMSTSPEVLEKIVHILLSSKGLYHKLVKMYCSSELKLQSQYDFLTLVFANISRLPSGRRLLLQDPEFMNNIKIIKLSNPESRRLGAALILRNCCLEIECHEKLLNNIGILPALLLPLMVPQKYEGGGEMGKLPPELQQQCLEDIKERDVSASVRRVLVEALTVLCYSEIGWMFLKSKGAYYVVRDLHAWEKDPVVKEGVEQLVAYLLVVQYSRPIATLSESSYLDQDAELIKQVEADLIRDLPDLVINDG